MKIYLAGPLFTPMERNFNIEVKRMLEDKGIEVKLPQDNPKDYNPGIIALQDLGMLETCDAILAICTGSDVDSGTAFEVGYGYAKGMDILLYRPDDRPYFNAMLQGTCDVARNLDDVMKHYVKLVK